MRCSGPMIAVASLTLALVCPVAAGAATTSPSETATIPSTSGDPKHLTAHELAEQIARADKLRAQILSSGSAIAAALTDVDRAASKANAALEAYSLASAEGRDAREKAATQDEVVKALQKRLDKARQDLREWAVDAYTQGGPLAEEWSYLEALANEAADVSDPMSDLNHITEGRIRSVEDIREVAIAQKVAALAYDAELARAKAAEKRAAKAKDDARRLVKEQQAAVDDLRAAHQSQVAEAGPLAGLLLGSGESSAVAASERLTQALERSNVAITDLRLTPCTDKDGVFPNGQIPPSNLCPLVGSDDEFLVPDAAAAFNAMSRAYAKDSGRLLCVTDGYRSYAEQVAIKAIRGPWAATPGTSEHGFGRALDLCGGVNDYSNPAHLWLKQNAALYGWFHPSWAAQGGSLPEPWHWEFAG